VRRRDRLRRPAARVSAGPMTRRDSPRPQAVATMAREANPSCERQPRRGRGVLRRDPDRHGARLLRRHQTPATASLQRSATWTAAPTVGVVSYGCCSAADTRRGPWLRQRDRRTFRRQRLLGWVRAGAARSPHRRRPGPPERKAKPAAGCTVLGSTNAGGDRPRGSRPVDPGAASAGEGRPVTASRVVGNPG
jgi:hypothetical protein